MNKPTLSLISVAALVTFSLGVSTVDATPVEAGNAVSPEPPSSAESLPAWGSEPVPQFGSGRSELHAISVLSESSAWVVGVVGASLDEGARPLVERWDGAAWKVVEVPGITGAELYGVVEVKPDNVWMVGTFNASREALVLHWDGTS